MNEAEGRSAYVRRLRTQPSGQIQLSLADSFVKVAAGHSALPGRPSVRA